MTALAIATPSPAPPAVSVGECAPLPQRFMAFHHQRVLGRYVGTGPGRIPRVAFAARINVTPFAVEKWFHSGEPSSPGLHTFLSAARVLGPAYLNETIEPSGMTGARRLSGPEKAPGIVLAEMAGQTAVLADALKDGHINRIENAEMRRTLPALIETLQNLQAQLARESA